LIAYPYTLTDALWRSSRIILMGSMSINRECFVSFFLDAARR
jgi:hypothetical protein